MNRWQLSWFGIAALWGLPFACADGGDGGGSGAAAGSAGSGGQGLSAGSGGVAGSGGGGLAAGTGGTAGGGALGGQGGAGGEGAQGGAAGGGGSSSGGSSSGGSSSGGSGQGGSVGGGQAGGAGGAGGGSGVTLLQEGFDTWPPTGWTIEDGGDTVHTWMQCGSGCFAADCTFSGESLNGATGPIALVDDDCAGIGAHLHEGLLSTPFDCTGYTTIELSFVHLFMHFGSGSSAVVEVSNDGSNYTPVATYVADTSNPDTPTIDISGIAANQSSVTVRFLYDDNSGHELLWMLDTVEVVAR